MSQLVPLPMIGANEDSALVVMWRKAPGELVKRGEILCEVETTKAVVEIEAEADGHLHLLAKEGETVRTGEPLAALLDSPEEDVAPLLAAASTAKAAPAAPVTTGERRWTKKAEILARRLNLSIEQVAESVPNGVVGEAEVLAFQSRQGQTEETPQTASTQRPGIERVLILGGARGGGAELILDALARIPHQHPVGILDRDPALHGQLVSGVPVLGPTSQAEDFWRSGQCDAVIIAFNSNLEERARLFEELSGRGVPFTNVIDATADVRATAQIGTGNAILACCHIGPYAVVGDNNFLSTFTCIEHHCRLGSHCAFGPSVAFSGRVTVGNGVRFGMSIAVEPDVTIGDNVIIASGSVLTRSIPSNSIVKARIEQIVRPR
ncbi:MAG TPA: biotin/lipoyl-containing protein [Chthonomonadaceae bacterium]|nr:biotin/lipoyl-containing protein [Chthonomonadaceae bacterium]